MIELTATEREIIQRVQVDVLETFWGKGNYAVLPGILAPKAQFCLVGLVRMEMGYYDRDGNIQGRVAREAAVYSESYPRILQAIASVAGADSVEYFNDSVSTTRERVIEVLDEVLA